MANHRIDADGGVLIVGAGLAGLFTALQLSPRPVTVLSPEPAGGGASTAWAQAGIAASLDSSDSPEMHAEDTTTVGGGLVDAALAYEVAIEAPRRVRELSQLGARFDLDDQGQFNLSREAGHRRARVAGRRADGAGQEIMAALVSASRKAPSVRMVEGLTAIELIMRDGSCQGVWARSSDGEQIPVTASSTVLATGGLSGLYATTTGPPSIRGEALGMAARAGAVIADAEFVQFHPTAIDSDRDPARLATEALRGEGAVLVDGEGRRFMSDEHPDADLAPRDIVARAIHRILHSGGKVCLDARDIFSNRADAFPNVAAYCRESDIDPAVDPIPVRPAAHFHIGGVRTDSRGRSSMPNLYACGEAAATGLHGANRLGSNSLLEATVFAGRVAEEIEGNTPGPLLSTSGLPPLDSEPPVNFENLRKLMSSHVGVLRNEEGLAMALRKLASMDTKASAVAAATLVAAAALRRRESRGAHWREDHPQSVSWPLPRDITLAEAERIREDCMS